MALITYLTRIQFDFGALKLLEAELQLLGMRRPLIVTDKGVIAAGLWARVKEQLPGNMPITLYDGTPENPTEAAMRDALKIYKEEGCDGIIAIGGSGSHETSECHSSPATNLECSSALMTRISGCSDSVRIEVGWSNPSCASREIST